MPEIKATKGSVTIVVRASEKYLELLNKMNGNTGCLTGHTGSGDEGSIDARSIAYNHMREILSKDLKENEKKKMFPIVEYFEEHDEISAEDAGQLVGKSASTGTRYLNKMIALGVIEKSGASYNTKYVLKGLVSQE